MIYLAHQGGHGQAKNDRGGDLEFTSEIASNAIKSNRFVIPHSNCIFASSLHSELTVSLLTKK